MKNENSIYFLNHNTLLCTLKIKIESRIIRLLKVGVNITQSRNHKSKTVKNKVVLSALHALFHNKFLHQEKKISYISISQNKYLFILTFLFLSF